MRYFLFKKQFWFYLVVTCCLIVVCKFWWDEIDIDRRFQKKRFSEFEKLEPSILNDVRNHLNSKSKVPHRNYSVLVDPYFTFQFRDIYTKPDSCYRLKALSVDYKLCPEVIDFISSNHIRMGMAHLNTYSYLLWILQHTPGAAYFDIGSNIGLIALPLIAAIGPETKVVALDANPSNVRALARGVISNGFPSDNWAIINRALSSSVDTSVELVLHKNSTNGAVKADIKDTKEDFTGPKIAVLSATIDSHVLPVALAMNITNAVMKIDIEGSECLAFQHAKSLLRAIYVPFIIMEYSLQMGFPREDCMEKLFAVMKNLSYYPFKVGSNGLGGMLDTKIYKYWLESDIIWKKIV